jgi:hypothetical protein
MRWILIRSHKGIQSKSQDEKWLVLKSRVIYCLVFCFAQYDGAEDMVKQSS